MKKLLLPAVMVAAFSALAYAQTNTAATVAPYPGLEGLGCVEMIEKMDLTLEEITVSDELKVQILELREQGITEISANDEDACKTSLTAAFQLLVPPTE